MSDGGYKIRNKEGMHYFFEHSTKLKNMRSKSSLMTIAILLVAKSLAAQVSDIDGNSYKTVKIDVQEWMAENLNVSHFRNGDSIPEVEDSTEWEKASEAHQPAWCYADPNDPVSIKRFHKLYNWYAVDDSRGLAPNGWHIPSTVEWSELTDFLGGDEVAGGKMKSTSGWNKGIRTNESGFSGLPGGERGGLGTFYNVGSGGYWWSSSEVDTSDAWPRNLAGSSRKVYNYYVTKGNGLSVRCVRD